MAATAISGLVALAVMTSMRMGMRAWEKEQQVVLDLRRTTNVEDIVHLQLSNYLLRQMVVALPNQRRSMPFFFGEPNRLVFLSSYSARERGRGGMVVADYFAQQQPDRSWSLWLDERPALDSEQLGELLLDIVATPEGPASVLRPFDRSQALLLWQGLRECRFWYRRETPSAAEWVPSWSLLANPVMPSAVALELGVDGERWRGLEPVPLFVRMGIGGVGR